MVLVIELNQAGAGTLAGGQVGKIATNMAANPPHFACPPVGYVVFVSAVREKEPRERKEQSREEGGGAGVVIDAYRVQRRPARQSRRWPHACKKE